jgi:hypothetical protein
MSAGKSRKFVESYFEGSRKNAMAALLQSAKLYGKWPGCCISA